MRNSKQKQKYTALETMNLNNQVGVFVNQGDQTYLTEKRKGASFTKIPIKNPSEVIAKDRNNSSAKVNNLQQPHNSIGNPKSVSNHTMFFEGVRAFGIDHTNEKRMDKLKNQKN